MNVALEEMLTEHKSNVLKNTEINRKTIYATLIIIDTIFYICFATIELHTLFQAYFKEVILSLIILLTFSFLIYSYATLT